MGQLLLLLVVALTVAAVVFGVTVLVTGRDPGLVPAEPDGRAVPLPGSRPLRESDVGDVRFDTALRGYRMAQVDQAMRRAAYDIGYKSELIAVLEAEINALREGRTADADVLHRAREEAVNTVAASAVDAGVSPVPADARSAMDDPCTDTEPLARSVAFPAAEPFPATEPSPGTSGRRRTDNESEIGDGDPGRERSDGIGQPGAVARSERA